MFPWGWEGISERVGGKPYRETFGSDEYDCSLDCIDGFSAYKYVKIYQMVHFKHAQVILCQLYLNKAVLFSEEKL